MSTEVVFKLLAVMATVLLGWLVGRAGLLGRQHAAGAGAGADPTQVLSNAALYVFVPALLFRTTARLDMASLPWRMIGAYFVPTLAMAVAVYALGRRRLLRQGPAAPATRTISAVFGNTVQLGIPMASALFGEAGLALHIALVSLHALLLLSCITVLAEVDLARAAGGATRWQTLRSTVRNTVIHPVVLPVLAGLAWNLGGLGLHPVADQVLQGLGSAVVPLCLVVIGLSLASYGVQGGLASALGVCLLKLLVLPALVLAVGHLGLGLSGTPLAVLVMMAALPVGSNALIFAQRYGVLQAEAALAIVISTAAFAFSSAFWLWVLARLAG